MARSIGFMIDYLSLSACRPNLLINCFQLLKPTSDLAGHDLLPTETFIYCTGSLMWHSLWFFSYKCCSSRLWNRAVIDSYGNIQFAPESFKILYFRKHGTSGNCLIFHDWKLKSKGWKKVSSDHWILKERCFWRSHFQNNVLLPWILLAISGCCWLSA